MDVFAPGQPEGLGARHRTVVGVPRARHHVGLVGRHQAEGAGQVKVIISCGPLK